MTPFNHIILLTASAKQDNAQGGFDISFYHDLLYIWTIQKEEANMTELEGKPKTSKEALTAIIVAGLVSIICILACTGIVIAFIINAPW